MAFRESPIRKEEEREDPRLIDTDFIERKSLGAEAYKTIPENERSVEEEAANDAAYDEAANDASSGGTSEIRRRLRTAARERIRKEAYSAGLRVMRRATSKISLRYALTIAGFVSFWQFVFALISLVGFGAQAAVLQAKEETTLGAVVGFFIDFEKYIPMEYLGMAAWAIAAIIGGGAFIGFMLFFYLTNVRYLDSYLSYIVFFACLAVTILPIVNIIPGLGLWILYLNATSLFSKR